MRCIVCLGYACGAPVKRDGAKYCSCKCAELAKQHYRTCQICGEIYKCPPSSSRVTCGEPECISAHKRDLILAGTYDDATRAMREAREKSERQRKGSPKHAAARGWVIQSPDGRAHECRNLLQWLRDHEDMLDGTPAQAFDGISKIKYSMQGKRKNKSYQWKGWRLLQYGD